MSGITALQGGQPDLELAAVDAAVLLAPYYGTSPLTSLEASGGGLNTALIGPSSQFRTVGNWTKDEGVTLTNKPVINDIKSHGKGSPTRKIASEAAKGIKYTPQQYDLMNLQNAWGFPVSAVTGPSAFGGVTVAVPELPYNLLWRCVLLSWDSDGQGQDIFRYWIANRASVGDRDDQQMKDSTTDNLGVSLSFETDGAVGIPLIFGVCGVGWQNLVTTAATGFASFATLTGITVTPVSGTLDISLVGTQQLTVVDSNAQNRTASCAYGTSDELVATVSATGLVTPVSAGTATITANYGGHSDTYVATVVA
jgi:hypothetical protein